MNYLTAAGLDNAGEMLCAAEHERHGIKRTAGSEEDADFQQLWHRGPIPFEDDDTWRKRFYAVELHKRVRYLKSHHRPVVVKAFTSAVFFNYRWLNTDVLFENFDVIVLQRRDTWRQVLSTYICGELKEWHPSSNELPQVKERLHGLRLKVDDISFMWAIEMANRLRITHRNVAAFGPQHKAICYEDFADSPRERLNELLGCDVKEMHLPVKFIEDHEAHVENIEGLRALYNRYALKD
jgi:hypothetical protein